jgi:hypothetical protein
VDNTEHKKRADNTEHKNKSGQDQAQKNKSGKHRAQIQAWTTSSTKTRVDNTEHRKIRVDNTEHKKTRVDNTEHRKTRVDNTEHKYKSGQPEYSGVYVLAQRVFLRSPRQLVHNHYYKANQITDITMHSHELIFQMLQIQVVDLNELSLLYDDPFLKNV